MHSLIANITEHAYPPRSSYAAALSYIQPISVESPPIELPPIEPFHYVSAHHVYVYFHARPCDIQSIIIQEDNRLVVFWR